MAHFAQEDNPKTYECYFDSSMINFITSHIRKCHPTFDRVQDVLQIRPKQIRFYSGPLTSLKFENFTFETLWKFELIDDGKKMNIKVRMCKIAFETYKGNLFIRYREMISNFVQTLNRLPSSVMRKLDYNEINQSIEIVYFTISRENVFQFKRQCILNKIWRDIRQEITEVFFFNIIYQETVSEHNTLKFLTFRKAIDYERTSRDKTCTQKKTNTTQDKNTVSSVLDLISPNNQKAQQRKELVRKVLILFKSISDSVRQQLQRMSGSENEIMGKNLTFPSNPNIFEIASLQIEYQCSKFKPSREQALRKDHSGNICQGITVIKEERTSKQPIQETNFSRIERMQVMFKYQLSVNNVNDALNDQNQQMRQIQIQHQTLINNNKGIQIVQNNDKNFKVGRIQFQNRQLIVKRCLKDKEVKNENDNVIRIKENLGGIWSFINQYVFIKFIRGETFPFIARYYLKVENQRQSQQRARTQEIIRNLKESFTKTMDGIMRTLQNEINRLKQTQTNDESKKQPSKATQTRLWRQMRRMVYTINEHTQRGLTHDMQVNERMIKKLQELLEETNRKIQEVLEISSREVFSPIREASSQDSNSESESGGLSTMERRSRDVQKNSTNVERKNPDLEGSSQDVQVKYGKRIQALTKEHSKKLRKIVLLPVADKQIYGDIYPERLYDFLEEQARNSQLTKVNTILYQIALTLFYLNEQKGILHRDIKTVNIMLDKMGCVKFIDWGSCCNIVDERKSKDLADKAFQEIDQSLKTTQAFTKSKRDVERQDPGLLYFLYQNPTNNDRSKFQNYNKNPYFDIYSYGSIVSRFINKLQGQCQLRDHWYVDQLRYLKEVCWERNPYDRPRPKMILVYLSELAKVIYEKSRTVFENQFLGIKSSIVLQE